VKGGGGAVQHVERQHGGRGGQLERILHPVHQLLQRTQPQHGRVPLDGVQRAHQLGPLGLVGLLSGVQPRQHGVEPRQLGAALVAKVAEELGKVQQVRQCIAPVGDGRAGAPDGLAKQCKQLTTSIPSPSGLPCYRRDSRLADPVGGSADGWAELTKSLVGAAFGHRNMALADVEHWCSGVYSALSVVQGDFLEYSRKLLTGRLLDYAGGARGLPNFVRAILHHLAGQDREDTLDWCHNMQDALKPCSKGS